jgi:dethiobiotin synthetase
MRKIIVAGIGTDVGKTVVSAILVEMLQGCYWKPIQCYGSKFDDTDVSRIKELVSTEDLACYPETYRLPHPLSPHQAASLEGMKIDPAAFVIPQSPRPLIIECAGGIMVPFTREILQVDVFATWNCEWVLVSRHYLGSINHTLLSLEVLKQRRVQLRGVIFNGPIEEEKEKAILEYMRVPCLARLMEEQAISKKIIKKYAELWKTSFCHPTAV